MPQPGFFDLDDRYEQLSSHGDPLVKLNELIPWSQFRLPLMRALEKERKSPAGRKPFNYIMMFKVLVLQSLYHLSDAQTEYQIRDRLSFMRFLGLNFEDRIPDEKTIWLFRETLVEAKAINKLFDRFNRYLDERGLFAKTGMMLDASIVEAPKQRNTRDENKQIKEGKTPEEWKDEPNKLKQKDVEARWTVKQGKAYYGYKNHINADAEHKLVRKFEVTPANTGDVRCFEELLDENQDKRVWADSAYRSQETEMLLKEKGLVDRMHHRPRQGGWLSDEHDRENKRRTKIRKRVEHVFGFITNSLKGKIIRGVGLSRATFRIGMMNLVYNFCRYRYLTQARSI